MGVLPIDEINVLDKKTPSPYRHSFKKRKIVGIAHQYDFSATSDCPLEDLIGQDSIA